MPKKRKMKAKTKKRGYRFRVRNVPDGFAVFDRKARREYAFFEMDEHEAAATARDLNKLHRTAPTRLDRELRNMYADEDKH